VSEVALRCLLEENYYLTLIECRGRLAAATGVRVDPWTIGRTLWRTDTAGVGGIAPQRRVFLDECGVLTTMARRYGRSPRGQRARARVPFGRWKRLSVLGAIATEGFIAAMKVEAATDSATLAAYLEQVLLPVLHKRKPDAVLVMDTLRAHKTSEVRTVLERFGFAYRYLTAYSPDLNQIEPGWPVEAVPRLMSTGLIFHCPNT
jgi:hypothetical protein